MALHAKTGISGRWWARIGLAAAAATAGIGMLVAGPVVGSASAATLTSASGAGLISAFGDSATGLCLDGNGAGDAYTGPCGGDNNYQMWAVTATSSGGNTLQSQATGRCLDSNADGKVYTSPCDGNNTYENWHLNTDSATTLQNNQTGLCLDSNAAGNLYTSPCNGDNSYQIWD